MERPSDWIERDPDLAFLADQNAPSGEPTPFKEFLDAQKRLDYPAAFLPELIAQRREHAGLPALPAQRPATSPATLRGPGDQPVTGDALGDHIAPAPG